MEGAKDVGEENIRASQQENESREEKYPEEKNETFNTASSENHHEVTNPTEKVRLQKPSHLPHGT